MYQKEIDSLIQGKIYNHTVAEVYADWKERDLLDETDKILRKVPPQHVEPIIYSFSSHVHKEKGLFLDLLGEKFNVPIKPRKSLAASADYLWALSLMVDDIADGDINRNGQETCWVRFGKQETINAGQVGLKAVLDHLYQTCASSSVVDSCLCYISLGLNSLSEHKSFGLDVTTGQLIRNYERRCDFHSTFQLAAMCLVILENQDLSKFNIAALGLRCINRAGQLTNDLKDLVGGDMYRRNFSDIQNGLPTVPIVEMYGHLPNSEADFFRGIFGKRRISDYDKTQIDKLITESHTSKRVARRIIHSYDLGLEYLGRILDENSLVRFEDWVRYKKTLNESVN